MTSLRFVSALSVALVAAPVAAQSAGNPDSAVINRILDSARALKLPETPLRSVLQEGRQRNESPVRIASALRMYVDVLYRARVALGNLALDAEIDAGASVLLAGGNVQTLTAVRAARPTADATVALVVLADLVERGVPLTRAEDAVVTLARVGASDAEFHSFRTGVQKDLAAGQGAESSLLKRTRETVSRLQIFRRKQRSFELRGAHIVTAPQWGTPERESAALLSPVRNDVRSQWALSARATPIARWSALELRAAAAGAFEGASEPGQTRGEIIATLGARSARIGVEAGIGAAAYTGRAPRLPVTYGGAWYERGDARVRLEFRSSPAGAWPRDVLEALNQRRVFDPRLATADSSVRTGETQASDSLSQGPRPGAPATISELRIGLSQGLGRVSLEATTGVRFLDATPLDAWNLAGMSARLRGRVGVIAGIATRYAILERAEPSGSFGYLGLRLLPRAPEPFTPIAPRAVPSNAAVPRARVQTSRGQSFLEIDAAGASFVEVTGDFTEWEARDMARVSATRWRIALPAAWQMIRVRVRVDGAEWIVPAGLARGRSVFGDEVGVLALAGVSSS